MFERTSGKTVLWIPLLMSLATGVLGVLPDFGTCPKVTTVENFDLQRFLGKWYEAERYFSIFSIGTKCTTSNYTMDESGAVRVIESHVSSIMTADTSTVGMIAPISKITVPKYNVRFDTAGIPYTMSYWVIGTDYDNYSVIWSCTNVGLFSFKSAWILTRDRQPRVAVLEGAYQILDRNQISRAYLFRTDQKNCPDGH